MTEPPRIKLIQDYQQIRADLIEAASFGRPVCPVLAGDLMALADKLSITERTQDFLRELKEEHNHHSPGPFSGVTGF